MSDTPRTDAATRCIGNTTAPYVRAEFARILERELGEAQASALRLATVIWQSEYQRESPDWRPLGTVAGIISQINNMFAGVKEQRDALRKNLEEAMAQANVAETERDTMAAECHTLIRTLQNEILRLGGLLRVSNTERNDANSQLRDLLQQGGSGPLPPGHPDNPVLA